MKQALKFIAILALMLSCEKKEIPRVTAINLNVKEVTLKVGEEYQFSVSHTPKEAPMPKYRWFVEDVYEIWTGPKVIAEIDETGKLKALKAGKSSVEVLTTNVGDINGNAFFSICKLTIENIEETGIKLNKSELSLSVGQSETLTYTIEPEDVTIKDVSWSSSDYDIASVDKGVVQAKKAGDATIKIQTKLGKEAICKVTVNPIKVTGLKFAETQKEVNIGENFILTATLTPENHTNKNITWVSSDPSVATVDSVGSVTTKSVGECEIKAKSEDGGFEAICKITVNSIKVTGINLDLKYKELIRGESLKLSAALAPENSTNKNITWLSSDPSVASVDESGLIHTFKVGECEITVRSEDGGFEAVCKLKILPIKVTGISFASWVHKIEISGEKQLYANILPVNADNQKLKWSSSNEIVVPVDENGIVKGNSLGRAIISVETEDGGYKATCAVEVAEIDQFIVSSFPSASVVVINGYLTGTVYSRITNSSSKSISVTKFSVTDGSYKTIFETGEVAKNLQPNQSTNYGIQLDRVYEPRFVWEFTSNGKTYIVSKQYGKD